MRFRGTRNEERGTRLLLLNSHLSVLIIPLSSQFSVLIFLGVAGAAGASQFLLNHKCHATREGEEAGVAGRGQNGLMVAERTEDL